MSRASYKKVAAAPGMSSTSPSGGRLQRQCACGNHTTGGAACAACSQPRAGALTPAVNEAPPVVYNTLSAPGQPLESPTRAFMEARFGRDFSRVRVHTNSLAAASARAVNALAYTMGRDIVFDAGEYAPQTRDGQRLIAHELAHVVQQSNQANTRPTLQRRPRQGPSSTDTLHDPLIEQYRQERGLPPRGVDPTTGDRVGPADGEIKFSEDYARWLRRGEVPAPSAAPNLAPVAGPFNPSACGVVTGGMPQAQAEGIRACLSHARYVNIMNQSVANMRQVASPYAPGLASLYNALLQQIITAGLANAPMPGAPKTFTVSNTNVAISSSTNLPVSNFTLRLAQLGPGAENGAYNVASGVLSLNEDSAAAWSNNQADIERTMYHEGFHFFSALVTFTNRPGRGAAPPQRQVNRELDARLTDSFQPRFLTTVAPLWAEALRIVTVDPNTALTNPTTTQLGNAQWFKVENEILSRVEEAIYLALRAGRGFNAAGLRTLPQPWLYQVDYWDSVQHFDRNGMRSFLTSKRADIDATVLPFIQEVQQAYLNLRPVS